MSLSRGRKSDIPPKVEINVVPLVDVALVLLIIFMVTTTFMKSAGVHIQLPSSATTRAQPEAKADLVVGIDRQGTFFWDNTPVSDRALTALLANAARTQGTDCRVIVQGDARAAHGRVVAVMTLAQQAGFARLVVATRQPAEGGRHAR